MTFPATIQISRTLTGEPMRVRGPRLSPVDAIKAQITALLATRGMHCSTGDILLTPGPEQALETVCRLLTRSSFVLTDRADHPELAAAAKAKGASTIPMPGLGGNPLVIDLYRLRQVLAHGPRPAFFYLSSEGLLSADQRMGLRDLAADLRIPVVEDGLTTYPLSIARGNIISIGTLAEATKGKLRSGGWIVMPQEIRLRLTISSDDSYRRRRILMLGALKSSFPAGSFWTLPDAGMFIWLNFADRAAAKAAFETCHEQGIGVAPASQQPDGIIQLRLDFSACPDSDIVPVIRRVGRALRNVSQTTLQ